MNASDHVRGLQGGKAQKETARGEDLRTSRMVVIDASCVRLCASIVYAQLCTKVVLVTTLDGGATHLVNPDLREFGHRQCDNPTTR